MRSSWGRLGEFYLLAILGWWSLILSCCHLGPESLLYSLPSKWPSYWPLVTERSSANGSPARPGQEELVSEMSWPVSSSSQPDTAPTDQWTRYQPPDWRNPWPRVVMVMLGLEGETGGEDQEIIYLFTGSKKLLCQNNRLNVTQLSPPFWVTQKPLNCSR